MLELSVDPDKTVLNYSLLIPPLPDTADFSKKYFNTEQGRKVYTE